MRAASKQLAQKSSSRNERQQPDLELKQREQPKTNVNGDLCFRVDELEISVPSSHICLLNVSSDGNPGIRDIVGCMQGAVKFPSLWNGFRPHLFPSGVE